MNEFLEKVKELHEQKTSIKLDRESIKTYLREDRKISNYIKLFLKDIDRFQYVLSREGVNLVTLYFGPPRKSKEKSKLEVTCKANEDSPILISNINTFLEDYFISDVGKNHILTCTITTNRGYVRPRNKTNFYVGRLISYFEVIRDSVCKYKE